jgi:kynurenine formamidase
MDAPNHFYQDKWAIDEIPIERLVARPAVVIDIRQKAAQSPDSNVTMDDVNQYEVIHGKIPKGAVIIQCSGWSEKYPDKNAVFGNDRDDLADFHFPGFHVDAVKWLIKERGAYLITYAYEYHKSCSVTSLIK